MPPRGGESQPTEMTNTRSSASTTFPHVVADNGHTAITRTANEVVHQENSPSSEHMNRIVAGFTFLEMEQHDYESSISTKDHPRVRREPLHHRTTNTNNNAIPQHTSSSSSSTNQLSSSPLPELMASSTSLSSLLSASSTGSTEEKKTTDKKSRQRKSVKFESLHIRTFRQILGDHPCCSTGLPLTFAWRHLEEKTLHIEDYETLRSPRRSRHDLRLSDQVRRAILGGNQDQQNNRNINTTTASSTSSSTSLSPQEDGLLSPIDLKRAERRTYRDRERTRKRTFTNKFFACPIGVE
jgi:hypothetical protein